MFQSLQEFRPAGAIVSVGQHDGRSVGARPSTFISYRGSLIGSSDSLRCVLPGQAMNHKSLVVVILLFVVGFAAWLALRSAGPEAPLANAPTARTGGEPDGHAAPVAASGAVPAGGLAASGEVERAAAELRATASPAGGALVMVRGRVVDRVGAPRPGVELALPSHPSSRIELNMERDPGAAPARESQSATTDAEGRFQLSLPKTHGGVLQLVTRGLVFANDAVGVRGANGDRDLGDIKVVAAGVLAGVVQDAAGAPVAGVRVGVDLGALVDGPQLEATAADGRFRLDGLRPGTTRLRATSSAFLPSSIEVELAPEQQRTDLVIVVKPGRAIAGHVIDERGVGVAGIKVSSKRREQRGNVEIERLAANDAAVTDANGYFTLSGIDESTISVRTFGSGYSAAVARDIAVGTGNLILRVQRLAVVEGVLLTADGQPIAGSRVTARLAGNAPGPFRGEVDEEREIAIPEDIDDTRLDTSGGRTAADGTFRIEGVTPGVVEVAARGKGHRPVKQTNVQVQPAATVTGVRLVADTGATARIQVIDPDGKPIADADVRIQKAPPRGGGDGSQVLFSAVTATATRDADAPAEAPDVSIVGQEMVGSGRTDASGMVAIAGLPAGDMVVLVSHGSWSPPPQTPLTLPASGAVETKIAMLPACFVAIRTLALDGSVEPRVAVMVSPADKPKAPFGEEQHSGTTDESGMLRLGPLAPGAYTAGLARPQQSTRIGGAIVVIGDGSSAIGGTEQQFTLVAGRTTEVELRRPVLTRLFGIMRGADGPIVAGEVSLVKAGEPALPGLGGGREVLTDADGRYELTEVEAGSYTIEFGKANQLVKARLPITIAPGTAELNSDLLLQTGTLRALVIGPDGAPFAGAEVEIERHEPAPAAGPRRVERRVAMFRFETVGDGGGMSSMTMGGQRSRSGDDGVVTFVDVPVGDWKLTATAKKTAPATSGPHAVAERQVTDCGQIALALGGAVRGTVRLGQGQVDGVAMVERRPVGGTWSPPEVAMNGSFRFRGVPVGRHQLRAFRPGGTGAPSYGPEVEVEVKAGETAAVDLQLPGQ